MVKVLAILIVALLIAVATCVSQIVELQRNRKLLTLHAESMAHAIVRDALQPVPEEMQLHTLPGVAVLYSEVPILTVNRWSNGLVGDVKSAAETQWSCFPGYVLKFDGSIPYCERR